MAVVSLMTGSIVSQLDEKPGVVKLTVEPYNVTGGNYSTPSPGTPNLISALDVEKMALAASVCFLVGVIQVSDENFILVIYR